MLQTDRQTDDICDRNTALCTKVHRAVKINKQHNEVKEVLIKFDNYYSKTNG